MPPWSVWSSSFTNPVSEPVSGLVGHLVQEIRAISKVDNVRYVVKLMELKSYDVFAFAHGEIIPHPNFFTPAQQLLPDVRSDESRTGGNRVWRHQNWLKGRCARFQDSGRKLQPIAFSEPCSL